MNPRSSRLSSHRRENAYTRQGRAPWRQSAHERIILANLASQLFEQGRIITTEAKAQRLRPLAEKLITKAKRGDIHAGGLVLTTVKDKGVVHTMFTEIAPTFADRDGATPDHQGRSARATTLRWRSSSWSESVEDSRKANAKSAGPAKEGASEEGRPRARHRLQHQERQSTSQRQHRRQRNEPAPARQLRPPSSTPRNWSPKAPAEELVGDTEEREALTESQQAPSDNGATRHLRVSRRGGARPHGMLRHRVLNPPAVKLGSISSQRSHSGGAPSLPAEC